MHSARVSHTATLLPTGAVLVAGGCSGEVYCSGAIFSSAELYDPATGVFTPTGSLRVPRGGATATLLADGQVLIAGGQAPAGNLLTSAELYDPATGTFTVTGSLRLARRFGTATRLHDGTVLVVGGDNFGAPVADAELYNPATGTWTTVGAPTAPHGQGATATLLASGQVLLAGGYDGGTETTSAALYDPASRTWSPTGAMRFGRANHTATLLANGQVLAAGGESGMSSAEVYNPATGTWTPVGALQAGRSGHTASLLPNGQVLAAGGCCATLTNSALSSAELFTPGAGPLLVLSAPQLQLGPEPLGTTSAAAPITITNVGTLPLHLGGITLGGSNPGDFAVSPGCTAATIVPGASCTFTYTYTPRDFGLVYIHAAVLTLVDDAPDSPQTVGVAGTVLPPHTWRPAASMDAARADSTATLLPDGRVLVAGGCLASGCGVGTAQANVEVYDQATGRWTQTGNLHAARGNHSASLLSTGLVLVAGGAGATGRALGSAELYHPATGTWTVTGSMGTARSGHTATLLPDGRVLVAGGLDVAGHALASAELYTPASGVWTPTGPMNLARSGHTATLLPNGLVLVAGGGTRSAEVYHPATGTWTVTGLMGTARSSHTATPLPGGQVLVAGGCCDVTGSPLASAEVYNPATGTWSATGSMTFGRQNHTATLLFNGQVLAAGGLAACDEGICVVNASAEVYSPLSGRWSLTGSMSTGREFQTATPLRNGTVLVAGGDSGGPGSSATPSAEIDTPPATALRQSSGTAGSGNAVGGLGFAPRESVVAYWGAPGALRLGSTTTGAQGSFGGTGAISFTVPSSATGTYAIYAVGQSSGNVAVSLFSLIVP
jgi:N-acetylneuraminic acid mutarotase